MTTAVEGGEGSASRPGRFIPPGKTRYPLYKRLGGPQVRSRHVLKISLPLEFDPRTVQPVARRYIYNATRPTLTNMSTGNISWRGKGTWCVGLTTLLLSCADCFEIWQPHPLGTLRTCTAIGLLLLSPFTLVLADRVC